MTKITPKFKIIGRQYAGKEGIVTAVYDQNRPERNPQVFRGVTLTKEALKDPTRNALRLTKEKNSDVIVEFLPAEALLEKFE